MTLSLFGHEPLILGLNTYAGAVPKGASWKPAFEAENRLLSGAATKHFAAEGARGQPRWPMLAASTVARKQRRFPGAPIMVETGTLRDSLADVNHPDHIFETTDQSMQWGTRVDIAPYHHRGASRTDISWVLPRRVLFKPTRSDVTSSVKIFQRQNLNILKAAKLVSGPTAPLNVEAA